MKTPQRFFFLLLLPVFFSCCRKKKYKGFTETGTGLCYKIKSIGEGTRNVQTGEYLLMHATYRTERDSLLSDSLTILKAGKPSFKGSFEETYEMMREGDHFVFVQSTDSLFQKLFKAEKPAHLSGVNQVKLELGLNKIFPGDEVAAERKKIREDMDVEEQRLLKQYIHENKIAVQPINTGMYYLPLSSTEGTRAGTGKYVALHYTGYFLDGRTFDCSRGKTSIEFTVGDQYQVIKGLEYGVSLMREGEKAKFIIPSHLAYGEKGSSTGIVPPYTTVIYEVELVTVK